MLVTLHHTARVLLCVCLMRYGAQKNLEIVLPAPVAGSKECEESKESENFAMCTRPFCIPLQGMCPRISTWHVHPKFGMF